MNMFNLTNRVAIVTGATGGFGKCFAQALQRHGCQLVLTGRDGGALATLRDVLIGSATAAGPPPVIFEADLLDRVAIDELVKSSNAAFGKRPTILINNAGIGHSDSAISCPDQVWDEVLALDLTAPFLLSRNFAQYSASDSKSVILNVASIFGLRPARHIIAYAAAKAALIQMTKSMALEFGRHGCRVNALAPGWCLTNMTRDYLTTDRGASIAKDIPLGRFGKPQDLEGPMLLLVSDEGSYINGATLVVDGGLSVGMLNGGR